MLEETFSGTSASLSAANGFAADGLRARGQGNVVTDFLYDPQGSAVQRQSSGGYNTGLGATFQSVYEGYGGLRSNVRVTFGAGGRRSPSTRRTG